MKYFGNKKEFSLSYELKKNPFDESDDVMQTWGIFQMWVNNESICTFSIGDMIKEYEWELIYIIEWLSKNKNNILIEEQFPLPVDGQNSIELYSNSGDFDSDDDDEFDSWFEKRQDWHFRHSWYSNNGGSYLADIMFRRVKDTIEIAWDNSDLFDEIKFINPRGLYYVPVQLFEDTVNSFIKDFSLEISKSEKGKEIIEKLNEE